MKMMTFSPTPRPLAEAIGTNKENDGNWLINNANELTLVCAKFQEILVVDFGNVNYGSMKSISIQLKNPNTLKDVSISIVKIPKKNGVSMGLGLSNSEESAIIPAGATIPGVVYWNPVQNNIKIREVIGLKMDGKSPLQITVQGICGNPELQVYCIRNYFSEF